MYCKQVNGYWNKNLNWNNSWIISPVHLFCPVIHFFFFLHLLCHAGFCKFWCILLVYSLCWIMILENMLYHSFSHALCLWLLIFFFLQWVSFHSFIFVLGGYNRRIHSVAFVFQSQIGTVVFEVNEVSHKFSLKCTLTNLMIKEKKEIVIYQLFNIEKLSYRWSISNNQNHKHMYCK